MVSLYCLKPACTCNHILTSISILDDFAVVVLVIVVSVVLVVVVVAVAVIINIVVVAAAAATNAVSAYERL